MLSRRELLSTLSTLWLARAARAGESLRARLLRLDEASRALAAGKLSPLEWQGAAGEVCQGIDLAELCRAVDLDRLAARLPLLDRGTSDEATRLLPGQTSRPRSSLSVAAGPSFHTGTATWSRNICSIAPSRPAS